MIEILKDSDLETEKNLNILTSLDIPIINNNELSVSKNNLLKLSTGYKKGTENTTQQNSITPKSQ